MCSHREKAYEREDWRCTSAQAGPERRCNCESQSCSRLANSEYLQDHGVVLPLFPGLDEAKQAMIVDAVADCLALPEVLARSA